MTHAIGIIADSADFALLARIAGESGVAVHCDPGAIADVMRNLDLALLIVAPGNRGPVELTPITSVPAIVDHAVPVFALVARGDAAGLAAAFEGGAADCAGYPIDPDEVRVRVRALLRRKLLDDRLRADAAEVRRIAHTDPVTGLWNRHYLDAHLTAAVARAVASSRPLSLLMIDIDRFKPINDRHGHAIGDKVLRAVAMRLAGGIRSIDTLARFGGDELVLVMPDTGIDAARSVAERLRTLVAEGTTEVPFTVTISIGVAELAIEEPMTALLAKADAALYSAKLEGRNRISWAIRGAA